MNLNIEDPNACIVPLDQLTGPGYMPIFWWDPWCDNRSMVERRAGLVASVDDLSADHRTPGGRPDRAILYVPRGITAAAALAALNVLDPHT